MSTTSSPHRWHFYCAGGLDQVHFNTGEDIANLDTLDPKLWVALACPVKGLEFDERTLALIDTDKDGRVRLPEITAAVAFLKLRLRNQDTLVSGNPALPLAGITDATPEGRAALASSGRILANLGKSGATSITFDDIADPVRIFAGTQFNGDGVIPPEAAGDDADTAAVLAEIVAAQGSTPDRSGLAGVDKARIDAFFAELKALVAWADAGAGAGDTNPFGDATPAAFDAVRAVRGKVDDYFSRCRLAAFDARTLAAVNRAEDDYLALAAKDLSVDASEVAGFPLARVEAGRALPLTEGVNPAWAAAVDKLRTVAVVPALGAKTSLTEAEWRALTAKLAAHEAWAATKPAQKPAAPGLDRARVILASGAEAKIADLLARDIALEAESQGIDAVEKLVRLNRDFRQLLQNFVSFADFYAPDKLAVFQAGRLYLDSRECHLCLRVEDAGRHAAMAGLSKCYLAYCDVSRKNEAGGSERMQILAVFSQGDGDYLMVGRNGVFIDRKGRDWDATIIKIIDAPISIRQAFFSPYKKFIRTIEEMIAKRAAAADGEANTKLMNAAQKVVNAEKEAEAKAAAAGLPAPAPGPDPVAAPAPPKEEKKIDLGTIALIGTAISGVAAMVGLVLEKFFGLGIYMPLGLLAVILGISGPSMIIAALKLRQRNLGPILDANGWAVNGRVKVNIPFGTSLTHAAKLPENAERTLKDPFAEKPSPWPKVIVALILMGTTVWGLWRFNVGFMDRFISEKLGKPKWTHVDKPDEPETKKTPPVAATKP